MKVAILFFLTINCFWTCNQASNFADSIVANTKDTTWQANTSGIKMILVDGKYNIWTKKVGDGKIKVLLLQGEPEFSPSYYECFEDFLSKEGIEFYYYDQLGTGNSDIPTDTTLWNCPRFVEEVEQVRKGLGLDDFYLLGHSRGGTLAMEYLQKYQQHVKAAIFSNMGTGMKNYSAHSEPPKKRFFTIQDIKTYDSLDRVKRNDSIQINKLHTWERLSNIKIPTLVIGGIYEEVNSEEIKKEGKLIPNSRTYLCPLENQFSRHEDQQNYFTNLIAFLKEVQDNKFVADKK
ncbi:alpha/beta fold hydrolase [Pedobacter sp. B4-66]|uniref:alpha/beta fold hydrolase n=1 Tax=Pedobacter sp. B4-66 TaxID=2817280 RepID=UPI001BD9ABD3|nr:alpha/beta fold hydrolase [Pedobacter sp. B4-66]